VTVAAVRQAGEFMISVNSALRKACHRRAVRALLVGLPGFATFGHEVTDIRRVDPVERVFFFGTGRRPTERAAVGEREVIGVARVFFRVEVRQRRPWALARGPAG
jgi:hypothetical protein